MTDPDPKVGQGNSAIKQMRTAINRKDSRIEALTGQLLESALDDMGADATVRAVARQHYPLDSWNPEVDAGTQVRGWLNREYGWGDPADVPEVHTVETLPEPHGFGGVE